METALLWLHVSGNIVWIGSILAVASVILAGAADPKTRGEIAVGVYRRLAVPAFVISFVAGAVRLGMDPGFYLKQHHWMHAKLPLALTAIALHHVIGGRAKKLAQGTVQDAGSTAIVASVLAVAAIGAVFFATFKLPN